MDNMPEQNAMEGTPGNGIEGLDPAELLRQGAAADTIPENSTGGFTPPTPEELASFFPQFEILGLIGRGGMGAVYKVRQPGLDRIVALKILPPSIAIAESFPERFTREAKAMAKLNHTGIVTIHEFGRQGDLYYFLMEYVDGVNLRQLLENGRISPREAMAIVPQICDALQFAHDQGIVHRDIKPENILLDRLGRVKVADFGIAKLVGSADSRSADFSRPPSGTSHNFTEHGKVIGTPQYMAPEQIESPTEVDHRADIFALGVVFYQMLTGELPEKKLQPPSRKISLDVRLDEVVLRALEKDPALRFSNVTEMKTRIEEAAADTGSEESNTPLPQKSKRGSLAIALSILGFFILFVFTLVFVKLLDLEDFRTTGAAGGSPPETITTSSLPPPVLAPLAKNQESSLDGRVIFGEGILPSSEMSMIDLEAGTIQSLDIETVKDAILPPFGLVYHQTPGVNGSTSERKKTDILLYTRAESFGVSYAPTGQLTDLPDPRVLFEDAQRDQFSGLSISVNRGIGKWQGYKITSADGSAGFGSFRISSSGGNSIEWTFIKKEKSVVGRFESPFQRDRKELQSDQLSRIPQMIRYLLKKLGHDNPSVLLLRREIDGEDPAESPVATYVALALRDRIATMRAIKNGVSPPKRDSLSTYLLGHDYFPNEETKVILEQKLEETTKALTAETKRHLAPSGQSDEGVSRFDLDRYADIKLRYEALIDLLKTKQPVTLRFDKVEAEAMTAKDLPADNRLQIRRVVASGTLGSEAMQHTFSDEKGIEFEETLYVSQDVIIWGDLVERNFMRNDEESFSLDIELNDLGTNRMKAATQPTGEQIRLAIIIDGRVNSAPLVHQGPLGKNFQINGFKTQEEAIDLIKSFPQGKKEMKAMSSMLWLMGIDEGKYEQSYEPASEILFKSQITKDQWVKDLTSARNVFGAFRGIRNIAKIEDLKSLPGVPDGEFRIVIFTSEFEKKKEATETVTLTKEGGEWKVAGYFIR